MSNKAQTALGAGGIVAGIVSAAGLAAGGPSVVELAREFGFPIAALCMLSYGCMKSVAWIGQHVVKPIVTSHTALVESLQANGNSNAAAIDEIKDTQRQMSATVERLSVNADADRKTAAQDRKILLLLLSKSGDDKAIDEIEPDENREGTGL